jgi:hypothetical protein
MSKRFPVCPGADLRSGYALANPPQNRLHLKPSRWLRHRCAAVDDNASTAPNDIAAPVCPIRIGDKAWPQQVDHRFASTTQQKMHAA